VSVCALQSAMASRSTLARPPARCTYFPRTAGCIQSPLLLLLQGRR
jgi:hypothetical protein